MHTTPQNGAEQFALALCRDDFGTFAEIGRAAGVDPFRVMDLWYAELRARQQIRGKAA